MNVLTSMELGLRPLSKYSLTNNTGLATSAALGYGPNWEKRIRGKYRIKTTNSGKVAFCQMHREMFARRIIIDWSEGFTRTGYFFPGRDGTGAWPAGKFRLPPPKQEKMKNVNCQSRHRRLLRSLRVAGSSASRQVSIAPIRGKLWGFF